MSTKVAEVHPGIYEIFLPLPMRPTIINVYLIDCGGGEWALIDTGMNTPESIAALEEGFVSLGIELERLDVLIATHHHIDHFGASGTIARRSGAQVYVNRLEAERARFMLEMFRYQPGDLPHSRTFFVRHGFPLEQLANLRPTWMNTATYAPATTPDHYVGEGDVIQVGTRRFEIIWTPGHTAGHNVIYLRDQRVMIVGDHLLPKITPHVGIYPDSPEDPLGDFIASQKKVQNFDVELVLPAHGGVYRDHRHRANQLIEHHHYREVEMLDIVRGRPQTAFEVSQQVFGDQERPLQHVVAATFETLAHLQHAYLQGRARRIEKDGHTLFFA